MRKGDHLKVDFGWYSHHGIDLGDGTVIHFGRGISDLENAKVEVVTTEVFSRGNQVTVVDSELTFDADEVVARAMSRLDERDYNLFDNNCEHFVTWCRSGIGSSPQVETSEALLRQAAAVSAKPILKKVLAKRLASSRLATSVGSRLALRLSTKVTGASIVGDVSQAAAEVIASKSGLNSQDAKDVGLKTGAATSAALGVVVGGPLGGAASLGLWFAGQLLADHAVETGKNIFNAAVAPNTTSAA